MQKNALTVIRTFASRVSQEAPSLLKINGQLKDRFDASVLEDAIKDIVSSRDVQLNVPQSTESTHLDAMTAARGNPDLLMKDDATGPSCKVYGCAFMGVFLATGLTNYLY